MTYTDMINQNDSLMQGGLSYSICTRNLAGLTPTSIAVLVAAGQDRAAPTSMISLHHFQGAAARIPVTDTGLGQRHDHLMVEIIAAWQPNDNDTPHRAWANDLDAALAQDALPGG